MTNTLWDEFDEALNEALQEQLAQEEALWAERGKEAADSVLSVEAGRAAAVKIWDAFEKANIWDKITDRVLTGGEIHEGTHWGNVFKLNHNQMVEEALRLVERGVTHVIDCRGEANEKQTRAWWARVAPSIQYLYVGTGDDGTTKTTDYFAKPVAWAMDALSIPDTKIYAHCQCGINRGPSMAAAILMAQGIQPALVDAMIRTARPCVGLAYISDAEEAVQALGWV